MKKTILITFTLFFITNIIGQNTELIKTKVDSINSKIKEIDDKISKLHIQRQLLKKKLSSVNEIKNKSELKEKALEGINTSTDFLGGTLIDSPNNKANPIIKIPANDSILIYKWYKKPYFKALYNDKVGYINKASIKLNDELKYFIIKKYPKLARLTKRFGSTNALRIINGQYWIGMTSAMAQESLGNPDVNNKTTSTRGITEQWVYNKKKRLYLYFENGKLTTYQN